MGSAIGPAFAGMFMQANQTIANSSYDANIVSFQPAMPFVNIFFVCLFCLLLLYIYLLFLKGK